MKPPIISICYVKLVKQKFPSFKFYLILLIRLWNFNIKNIYYHHNYNIIKFFNDCMFVKRFFLVQLTLYNSRYLIKLKDFPPTTTIYL